MGFYEASQDIRSALEGEWNENDFGNEAWVIETGLHDSCIEIQVGDNQMMPSMTIPTEQIPINQAK